MDVVIKDGVEYHYNKYGELTYEKYPNGEEYYYEYWIDEDRIKRCCEKKITNHKGFDER